MEYLLDTNICIFYLKRKYDLERKMEKAGISNCCISEITAAELLYGAYKSEFVEDNLKEADDFMQGLTIIPVSDCLHIFGQQKAHLKKLGQLIGDFDIIIGATAIYYDLTVDTQNTKHFERLQNIRIEDWTKP